MKFELKRHQIVDLLLFLSLCLVTMFSVTLAQTGGFEGFSNTINDNSGSTLHAGFNVFLGLMCIVSFIICLLAFVPKTSDRVEYHTTRIIRYSPLLILLFFLVYQSIFLAFGLRHIPVFLLLGILSIMLFIHFSHFQNRSRTPQNTHHVPRWESLLLVLWLISYMTVAWIFAQGQGGGFTNTDALGYMQIARQYSEAEFVVRGYWSPLISWLAAFLTIFGIELQPSMYTVLIFSGGLWVAASWLLARRVGVASLGRLLVVGCISILALSYLPVISTDTISSALLTMIIIVLLSDNLYKFPLRYAVLVGILATLAYYAKAYNLPLFFLIIILFSVYGFSKNVQVKQMLRFTIPSIIVFLVLISPWIMALSERYDEFTFSTASEHTRGLVAPGGRELWAVCVNGTILCDQPEDVLFPWEDHLPEYQPGYGWSPFQSLDLLFHQINLTAYNIFIWASNTLYLFIPAMLLFAVYLYSTSHDLRKTPTFLFLLLVALGNSAGYMLSLSGPTRYTFPTIMIFAIFVAYLIQQLSGVFDKRIRRVSFLLATLGLFFGSFSVEYGGREIVSRISDPENPVALCRYNDTIVLREDLIEPIASVDVSNSRIIHFVSYYTRTRTYGALQPELYSVEEINRQLTDFGIRTVLVRQDFGVAEQLQGQYDYELVINVSICDTEYEILYLG